MEILSTTTHSFEYYFGMVVFGILALIFLSGLLVSKKEGMTVFQTLLLAIMFILFSTVFYQTCKVEPKVSYKVKIEDFNEVYEKGYKIIRQDGKIYTLEKERKK